MNLAKEIIDGKFKNWLKHFWALKNDFSNTYLDTFFLSLQTSQSQIFVLFLFPISFLGYQMFTWRSYLEDTNGQAAPKENFLHFHKPPKSSELNGWKIGLKLEAVDRSNTSLICVATVTNVMDGRVLIHFDGWDLEYDYWVTPSSPYIHPKGNLSQLY